MKGSFGLVIGVIVALLAVVIIASPIQGASTVTASETESVVTASGVTTAVIPLDEKHWYSDNTGVSVSCATDASPTVGALTANRQGINVSALTASTTQVCTLEYLKAQGDSTVGIVLSIVPFLLLMGGLLSAFGGTYAGIKAGMGDGMGSMVTNLITTFIGIVLIPVILSFSSLASAEYTNQPEFIGVTAILPLVSIGYVLSLLGSSFGGFAPKVRNIFGN